MLKQVTIDRMPNGKEITIPAEVNEKNFDQQIKRFIEIADSRLFDGQLHLSLFRTCHGGQWTLKILDAVIRELLNPGIDLRLSQDRGKLLPFFEHQRARHETMSDDEFRLSDNKPMLPI